jgi:hypothetical protein
LPTNPGSAMSLEKSRSWTSSTRKSISLTVPRTELAERHKRLANLLTELRKSLPNLPSPPKQVAPREATLGELAQAGTVFIRRAVSRPTTDQGPTIHSRVLTGRDVALGQPPSEISDFPDDEIRYPAIRVGDVLVPVLGQRLTARVATDMDIGARPASTIHLIRPDAAIIDPWFLVGLLSSNTLSQQAARASSTLGEHIRFDLRRVRIPLLPIDAQREYGEIFRELSDFTQTLRNAHDLGTDLVGDMTDSIVADLSEGTAPYVQ